MNLLSHSNNIRKPETLETMYIRDTSDKIDIQMILVNIIALCKGAATTSGSEKNVNLFLILAEGQKTSDFRSDLRIVKQRCLCYIVVHVSECGDVLVLEFISLYFYRRYVSTLISVDDSIISY